MTNEISIKASDRKRKLYGFQLRFLIPIEWVPHLDRLAAARCVSRLALLRAYVKEMMEKELKGEHLRRTL